jgi:Redoxin
MKSISQQIEIVSHIAIIIVAILISVVLVKTYLIPNKTDDKINAALANSGAGGPQTRNAAAPELLGKKISLPDTNFEKNGQTLVLALSTGCHFCTESASFYKELVQKRAKQGNIHLIAVLPQPVDASRKYLNDLGVTVDDVKQLTPSSIGVRGTPTLLLVNKEGVVTESWIGKLSPPKETEVLSRLQTSRASR